MKHFYKMFISMFISMFNLFYNLEFDKELIWNLDKEKNVALSNEHYYKNCISMCFSIFNLRKLISLYFSTLLTLRLKESLSCATWSRVNFDHEALHTAPP